MANIGNSLGKVAGIVAAGGVVAAGVAVAVSMAGKSERETRIKKLENDLEVMKMQNLALVNYAKFQNEEKN